MFRREDYQTESGKLMAYAWPGGYPLYYVCKDGGVLCPECASGPECAQATADCPDDAQWLIVAAEVNWENPALTCDHCNKRIESAYADEDTDEDTDE